MNFFQHRYYKLPKTFMTLIGQWPYQSNRVRFGFLGLAIIVNTSQIAPLIAAYMKHHDDQAIVLDCFIAIIVLVSCFTKLIFLMWNSQSTLHLVNRIRTDWQLWARDREVDILHKYAQQGQKPIIMYTDLSILRTAILYSSIFIFITEPIVPKIIDVLLMNGTEPGRFPYPVEYNYFNKQKYYFYIIIYSSVYTWAMCTVSLASDTMLIVYIQHGCGIFAALGHKLERIGNNVTSKKTRKSQYALDKRDVVHIASCIDRHNDALEYANHIETIYAWIFFVVIGLGTILFNLIALQIFMRKSSPKSAISLIISALSLTTSFFILSYLAQILTDHSDSIRSQIHNSQWYRLSPKAQKLLKFMTMRCNIPCQLTVGKLFVMSMKTFGVTVKTTLSYFMTVRSMQ